VEHGQGWVLASDEKALFGLGPRHDVLLSVGGARAQAAQIGLPSP
jgi:hypothetical protein